MFLVSFIFQAFIIAFTCDFIPKCVYFYYHSENFTMNGYFNKTLSWFGTHDLMNDKRNISVTRNYEIISRSMQLVEQQQEPLLFILMGISCLVE